MSTGFNVQTILELFALGRQLQIKTRNDRACRFYGNTVQNWLTLLPCLYCSTPIPCIKKQPHGENLLPTFIMGPFHRFSQIDANKADQAYSSGDFFGHLCGMDCASKCRKIEFFKKILEFLRTKFLSDDIIVTIKI